MKPEGVVMNSDKYQAPDKAFEQPVLKRELFANSVVIESVELLRDRQGTFK
jgi:hypothetical protein